MELQPLHLVSGPAAPSLPILYLCLYHINQNQSHDHITAREAEKYDVSLGDITQICVYVCFVLFF